MLPSEEDIQLFGVVGYPLSHSLSPLLHNWALKKNGLPGVYVRWEVLPDNLAEFMVSVRTLKIRGISVTLPFKERVIPYLDALTDDAREVGAVNHLFWEGEDLIGNNTDVEGFLSPIISIDIDSALVLGTGGAALAVLCGLLKKDVKEIYMAGRNIQRLYYLRERFGILPVPWEKRGEIRAHILINATPIGMSPHIEEIPYPAPFLKNFSMVYDLVYNPQQTQLLREAQKRGCDTIGGLTMFVFQALLQFKQWTGLSFDPAEAKSLLTHGLSS